MADYISRKAALDLAYWHGEKATVENPDPYGVGAVDVCDIESMPAADVIEVVRCRDCKYQKKNNENEWYCVAIDGLSDPWGDRFCSYGKRR